MGCAVSGSTAEKEARARTNAIEKQLKLDRERAAREVKLLLLGLSNTILFVVFKEISVTKVCLDKSALFIFV